MARRQTFSLACTVILSILFLSPAAQAAQPCAGLLPVTTKGYVSIPDVNLTVRRWNETQLGRMLQDPVMQPFVADVRAQIEGKLLNLGERLGVEVGQLQELRGGEVCLAMIQPDGVKSDQAAALIMNVEGRADQAARMLDALASRLAQRGAQRRHAPSRAGVEMTILNLPNPTGTIHTAHFAIHRDMLLISDHKQVMEGMLERLQGQRQDSLARVAAFRATTMQTAGDTDEMHVRWFIEPFGLAETLNAAQAPSKRRTLELVNVLANQGFKAIQGIGGTIVLSTEEHEILHRTMIYAPSTTGVQGPADKRYQLAARMLEFPNSDQHGIPTWFPSKLSSFLSLRCNIAGAFEHSKSLVNEALGEEVFEEILHNIETDPNGPRVNIRQDVIAHLGQRIMVATNAKLPITPESEQLLVAVELTDAAALAKTLDKAMKKDPSAKLHEIGKYRIWEMGAIKEKEEELPQLVIDDPFGVAQPVDKPEEEKPAKEDSLIPNFCLAVANGHLIASNRLERLVKVLVLPTGNLAEADDYKKVQGAIERLGSAKDSFRFFVRTDEAYRPTYELLRNGQMPESKTLAGMILNRILGPRDGEVRSQHLDGSKMPDFEAVRHYLGPAGLFVRSRHDGWIITGCLLTK